MTHTRLISLGTSRIAFDVTGAGHPLVLLHSGLGDRTLFDEQLEAFAALYQVVRIDLRGFGESWRGPEAYRAAEDVLAVMDELGLARFHVLGVSLGSQVAIDVAVIAPERVTGLVAVSARCGTPAGDQLKDAWADVDRIYEEQGIDAAVEREAQMWVDGHGRPAGTVDPVFRERLNRLNRAVFLREDTEDNEEDIDPPAADRLAEIAAPTLVMWGQYDFPVYAEAGAHLAATIPGAQALVIADSAHLPNNEQPATFNEAVLAFLASVGSD
ncbi:MAG: alpha/beta hydrolase [Chloroflexota bacterium]|jgi:3-oxoadipate enol-lactonase|nr:alpha/beta hydrolase [Chloroflexota bacterium]